MRQSHGLKMLISRMFRASEKYSISPTPLTGMNSSTHGSPHENADFTGFCFPWSAATNCLRGRFSWRRGT